MEAKNQRSQKMERLRRTYLQQYKRKLPNMTTISIMLDKKEEMTDGLMRTKLDLTKMKLL